MKTLPAGLLPIVRYNYAYSTHTCKGCGEPFRVEGKYIRERYCPECPPPRRRQPLKQFDSRPSAMSTAAKILRNNKGLQNPVMNPKRKHTV